MDEAQLRTQVRRLLAWRDAHADFDAAVEGLPAELRGVQPAGLPYSAWQLLEHMRLAQQDILEFCIDPQYRERDWPEAYWPASPAPTGDQWERSIEAFHADVKALEKLAAEAELFDRIPHGTGQTYLRELLLVADHNAYHIGQLVLVRRLLGAWPQ